MDSLSFEEPPETEKSNDFHRVEQKPPRWKSVWLAWLAILASLVLAVSPHFIRGRDEQGESSIFAQELYGKYLIAVSKLPLIPKDKLRDFISSDFDRGPLRQRMMAAVLRAELEGAEAAVKSLEELRQQVKSRSVSSSPPDEDVLQILLKMQQSRTEKQGIEQSFNGDELHCRNLLMERLGWFGKLALLPPETTEQLDRSRLLSQASRTAFVIAGAGVFMVMAMICGVILQLTWWIFAAAGRLSSGIGPIRGDYVVYAETFAVWMVLFVALSYLTSLPFIGKWGKVTVLISQIGALSALGWPVIRGLRWRDVRQDIGLTLGRQSWTAPLIGIGTYLSALPAVVVGALIMLAMMALASQLGTGKEEPMAPSHPVVESILRGNWTERLQVLLIVVFAAVPEEIIFRGFLYRHLRELGAKFGYVTSVVFAALVNSLIFAAIHPQGVFGIPLLMGLAIVFSLAREWRGTLIPSMIAHAMVNTGTTSILFLIAE